MISAFELDQIERFNASAPSFIWTSGKRMVYEYDIPVKWLMNPLQQREQSFKIEWGPLHSSTIKRSELSAAADWVCKLRGADGIEIQPKLLKIQAYKGRNLAAEFIETPKGISRECVSFIRKKKISKLTLEVSYYLDGNIREKQAKRSFIISSD